MFSSLLCSTVGWPGYWRLLPQKCQLLCILSSSFKEMLQVETWQLGGQDGAPAMEEKCFHDEYMKPNSKIMYTVNLLIMYGGWKNDILLKIILGYSRIPTSPLSAKCSQLQHWHVKKWGPESFLEIWSMLQSNLNCMRIQLPHGSSELKEV